MGKKDFSLRSPTLTYEENLQEKESWYVEYLPSEHLDEHSLINWKKQGEVIALMQWLGFDDLHHENLHWAATNQGYYLFPLDIESMGKRYLLLSQMNLLPQREADLQDYGLRPLRKYLRREENFFSLINAYGDTIEFLNAHAAKIHAFLAGEEALALGVHRILLRPTQEYGEILKKQTLETYKPSLYPCEYQQLKRGDIPYFFTDKEKQKIYEYDEKMNPREVGEISDKVLGPFRRFQQQPKVSSSQLQINICQILKWGIQEGALNSAQLLKIKKEGDVFRIVDHNRGEICCRIG